MLIAILMSWLLSWTKAKLNRLSCAVPPPSADASSPRRRVLVLHCHPDSADPNSLSRKLEEAVLAGLAQAHHEVRLRRLYGDSDRALTYGEGAFDPVLSAAEKACYANPEVVAQLATAEGVRARLPVAVAEAVEDLRWCDTLVFVYPTWWFSFPAVLKGYFDR